MKKKQQGKQFWINEQIRGDKIMLIDEEGNKLGIFSKNEALKKAEEEGKDVIQVGYNPKEWVVIAKFMEYGKFMYQLKKQEKEKKKNQKVKWMKEIKISYNIWQKDLELKLKKAEEFLKEWYNVKILWELRWRENWFKDTMYKRMQEIEKILWELAKSQGIKEEKRWFSLILFAKVK